MESIKKMKIIIGILFTLFSFGAVAQSQYLVVKQATAAVSNTYTASITGVSSYGGSNWRNGVKLQFLSANTGSATLNINGLGAVTLQKLVSGSLTNLSSGDIVANYFYDCTYNGTVMVLDLPGTGGSLTLTDGSGTTANGTAVDLGGAVTANTTYTGNFNWTWASNGSRMGDYRVWSGGTIGLDASTSSFLQVGSNTITVDGSQAQIQFGSSRFRAKADSLMFHTNSLYRLKIDTDGSWDMGGTTPGTSGQVLTSNGSSSAPTWEDPSGGVTPVTGSGLTWSIDRYNLGGSLTGNVAITTGSNNFMVHNDNESIVFNGAGGSFTYTGISTLMSMTSTGGLSVTGPIRFVNLAGTGDRMVMADADGDLSTVLDPRKLPSIDKTSSFVAAVAEAGVYHYNITPGSATTITFPDLTGQEGLQWSFWKNVDADAVVFDFGAETANGATVLPDTSWVYVNWSDGRFKVAGTNPATGGGSSGTVESVVAGNLIDVDATDPANPIVSVETGDKGDITLGSNTLTIDNNAVTNAKINDVAVGKITGTLPVTNGGLGIATLTANGIITGGTTSTGAVQQIGVSNVAGRVLTANASGLPSFQDPQCLTGAPLTLTDGALIDFSVTSGDASTALVNAITITADLSGIVPVANGGTGFDNTTQTYNPTVTAISNITGTPTASTFFITRVGSMVDVDGQITFDPTTTLTSTTIGISIPVPSNFTTSTQAFGVGAATTVSDNSAGIISDATNDRVTFQYVCTDVTNHTMQIHFRYQIL